MLVSSLVPFCETTTCNDVQVLKFKTGRFYIGISCISEAKDELAECLLKPCNSRTLYDLNVDSAAGVI